QRRSVNEKERHQLGILGPPVHSLHSHRTHCRPEITSFEPPFLPQFPLGSGMSKAFTREDDNVPDQPAVRRTASALPPGAKNYLTVAGERRLRAELEELLQSERSGKAGETGKSGARRERGAVEQRIAHLEQC